MHSNPQGVTRMASKNSPLVLMTAKKAAPSFHDAEVADVMGDLAAWYMPGQPLLTEADLAGAIAALVIPPKD
jgi:hypothetical protein